MKRNSGIVIATIVGVAIVASFIAFTGFQESEIKNDEPIDIDFGQDASDILPEVNDRLDEIEKKAAENKGFEPAPRDWQTSGPFQIDRTKYLLGETVFIRIGALEPTDKGQIVFLRSLNTTHYDVYQTIPFDGMSKSAFNYYTKLGLSLGLGICDKDDVVGEWVVVFRGTNYENIKFEVVDEFLPGEEDAFVPVC